MQRKWGIRWAAYLVTVVILFAALEVPAIADPAAGDTLSEFIRTGIQYAPEALGTALLTAPAWFGWHILRKVR